MKLFRITEKTRKHVASKNRLDQTLYDYAAAAFYNRLCTELGECDHPRQHGKRAREHAWMEDRENNVRHDLDHGYAVDLGYSLDAGYVLDSM